MQLGLLLAGGLLFSTFQASAAGLSAAILKCDESTRAMNIGADIATAVVRSLIGTALDTVVAYLDDDRALTFDVILPVDSLDSLTDKCLYMSSGDFDDQEFKRAAVANREVSARFFAKLKFVSSPDPASQAVRPIVLVWKYSGFLEPNCPYFRNCDRRDVAVSLQFLQPASTIAGRTVESEPLGFVVADATPEEIERAIPANTASGGASLPWFLAGSGKGPRNIRFSLVETSKPNAFTRALGSAIAAQKAVIQDKVDNRLKGISDQLAATAAQKDVASAATALDEYKKAYDIAAATALALSQATDPAQKLVLRSQYAVQRASARLAETLARAAFKVAGIEGDFPADGLGKLPDPSG